MTEFVDVIPDTAVAGNLWLTIGVPAALAILLLCGMAFVSSIEAALAGVSASRARDALEKGTRNARFLAYWVENPGVTLVTLHLLRLGFVIGIAAESLRLAGSPPFGLPHSAVVGIVAVIVLTLGVLIPRAVGKRFALEWACATIRVVRVAAFVLAPVVWPVTAIMRGVARVLNVPAPERRTAAFWTPEEQARVSVDAQASALEGESEALLRSITEFSDTVVQEIMVPRTDMVALQADATPEDVRRTVVEAGHSRIPVYEETIDNLAGLLYVKDLTASPPRDDDSFDLKTYVRKTFYVPEVMKISDLLREFQKRKTHLAIVVDEYGGTAGLVTLEDIIEEIVGEIQDEYDVEESQFRVIGDNKIIADGRVSIWDLEETLGVEFPDGGYETLAGFLTAQAGDLPRKGDLVAWKNLRFTVKEANEKRIGMVEIERIPVEAHAPLAS